MAAARYLVGIDLGTTNTACAYVDAHASSKAIRVFPIPQLVAPGRVETRETLPSFCYLAGEHDLPAGSLDLPWATGRSWCAGVLAREQGARVSGRLVASAKSWLCHGGVDRTAPILPWGAAADVAKLSPVDASARTLAHLREAWDARFPEPLAEQDVVLTVPASFDEAARELTLEAAAAAGVPRVVLVEEPLAAFYAWLVGHERDWRERVATTPVVLVVDVGGGTTDFSIVAARGSRGEVSLERVAVGDHLLLGGDNMDIALARAAEARLVPGGQLDAPRFHLLVSQCRAAKESMLADGAIESAPVTVPGRGTGVVGGTLATAIGRGELEGIVLDGFFPVVSADARPDRRATGIREWGLPFAPDAGITRHLAEFLARQRAVAGDTEHALVRPDAILFNGGALEPPGVRERIASIVGEWHDPGGAWRPAVLDADSLQLAVARGAAAYALARRGIGIRIGSGAARTYYLGLQDDRLLCLVPRGMEEGESADLARRELELVTNRPVAFPLFTATDRTGEEAGDVVEVDPAALTALPPLRTVVRFGKKLEERTLPVHLEVRLTEIGTLELWLKSRSTEHRWRLALRLRDTVAGEAEAGAAETSGLVVAPEALAAAETALRASFDGGDDPVTVMRRLETALDAGRDAWPLGAIRSLWDALWSLEARRERSPAHEARWLNLAGFLLRPGFGDAGDGIRVEKLWRVLGAELRHPRAVQCRAEVWNLWKRVAGGLNQRQQQHLLDLVRPALTGRGKPKGPKPGPQEQREMWQAIGGCERIAPTVRAELALVLAQAIAKGRATDQEAWALGRLAGRAPVAGPMNCVTSPIAAAQVVELLLTASWSRPEATAFALAQVARMTGDRERDLAPALREKVAVRLAREPDGERLARLVREVVPLEARDEARLLDESLPAGLRLRA
jgi:molecular chaperone DnaK (HSP70)